MAGIPWPKLSSDLPPTFEASATPPSFLDCCRFYSTATPSPQYIIIAAYFVSPTHHSLSFGPIARTFGVKNLSIFRPHIVLINRVDLFCSSTLFLLLLNILQHALCIAFQAQWVFPQKGKAVVSKSSNMMSTMTSPCPCNTLGIKRKPTSIKIPQKWMLYWSIFMIVTCYAHLIYQ